MSEEAGVPSSCIISEHLQPWWLKCATLRRVKTLDVVDSIYDLTKTITPPHPILCPIALGLHGSCEVRLGEEGVAYVNVIEKRVGNKIQVVGPVGVCSNIRIVPA